jgi:hypothetical protein
MAGLPPFLGTMGAMGSDMSPLVAWQQQQAALAAQAQQLQAMQRAARPREQARPGAVLAMPGRERREDPEQPDQPRFRRTPRERREDRRFERELRRMSPEEARRARARRDVERDPDFQRAQAMDDIQTERQRMQAGERAARLADFEARANELVAQGVDPEAIRTGLIEQIASLPQEQQAEALQDVEAWYQGKVARVDTRQTRREREARFGRDERAEEREIERHDVQTEAQRQRIEVDREQLETVAGRRIRAEREEAGEGIVGEIIASGVIPEIDPETGEPLGPDAWFNAVVSEATRDIPEGPEKAAIIAGVNRAAHREAKARFERDRAAMEMQGMREARRTAEGEAEQQATARLFETVHRTIQAAAGQNLRNPNLRDRQQRAINSMHETLQAQKRGLITNEEAHRSLMEQSMFILGMGLQDVAPEMTQDVVQEYLERVQSGEGIAEFMAEHMADLSGEALQKLGMLRQMVEAESAAARETQAPDAESFVGGLQGLTPEEERMAQRAARMEDVETHGAGRDLLWSIVPPAKIVSVFFGEGMAGQTISRMWSGRPVAEATVAMYGWLGHLREIGEQDAATEMERAIALMEPHMGKRIRSGDIPQSTRNEINSIFDNLRDKFGVDALAGPRQ